MRILSYNVNGIRSALKKGLADWLSENPVDLLCIQETKAQENDVPAEVFEALGFRYSEWHSAQKKGYSGVATFSKVEPTNAVVGCGMKQIDEEGRILRTDFGNWSLLNCYFPSGTTGDVRQDFKMTFLEDYLDWIEDLKKERPNLLVLGDFNIAHTEMDIHNPKSNKNTSGFLPEEREWLSKWLGKGYVDTFRHCHPEKIEYSWWSFRANARANNKGWRIDYQVVSEPLLPRVNDAGHHNDAVHSDHCPVWLELDV